MFRQVAVCDQWHRLNNVSVSYSRPAAAGHQHRRDDRGDAIGLVGTVSETFDTFSPNNFIVKAEEFDYNSGQFIDNPDYTATNGDANSYFGLEGTEGIDMHKGRVHRR